MVPLVIRHQTEVLLTVISGIMMLIDASHSQLVFYKHTAFVQTFYSFLFVLLLWISRFSFIDIFVRICNKQLNSNSNIPIAQNIQVMPGRTIITT